MTPTWPKNDREWARDHIGCNVTTCPNGKCRATGECVDLPTVKSPPLAPGLCYVESGNPCIPTLLRGDVPMVVRDGDRVLSPTLHRTIVAFTGLAGAGKSTAAMHLVNHRGFERVRFAGPLKAMMAALGCTAAEIDGDRKELPCHLLGGKTPRWAMQTIGTEWGRKLIDSELWVRAWRAAVDRLPAGTPVVVDDCRFPNEAEAIRAAGGLLVRIERAGAGTASTHKSEQHQIEAVRILHNTRDERSLREQVDVFLRDLSWADL